jgi:hypothetical protein
MCIKWRDPGAGGAGVYPGLVRVNKSNSQSYLFYGERSVTASPPGVPTAVGYSAVEARAYDTTTGTPSAFDASAPMRFPVDTPSFPATSTTAAQAPFTSSFNDVIGIAPQAVGDETAYSPTGSFANATYDPLLAKGLLARYGNEQAANPTTWWQQSMLQPIPAGTPPGTIYPLRFNAMTSVARPVASDSAQITQREKAALLAPFLASGCSNFIVEFAGDFLSQDPNGTVTGNIPDGILDFDRDGSGGVQQTQWYGMPRDVDGNGIATVDPSSDSAGGDVVPVHIKAGTPTPSPTVLGQFPFEKAYTPGGHYIVAFGPADLYATPLPLKPSLIRITVDLVDAGGNLTDGLSREFVFKVR